MKSLTLQGHKLRGWLAACVAVGLLLLWGTQITDAPLSPDASQSLQMAVNLAHFGTLAFESGEPRRPTNYREPLPPMVSALGVLVIDAAMGKADSDSYFSGTRLRYLKYQNLLWLAILAVGTFLVVAGLTSSYYAGLLAVLLVNVPFRPHHPPGSIDDLVTEIPAAALLVAASGAFALGVTRHRTLFLALAGALFGALTLTKAMGLYVFVALLFVVACGYVREWPRDKGRTAVRDFALLIVPFTCLVLPWILRNYAELGTFSITQRAGIATLERSHQDMMTPEEYRGAIYFWAPILKPQLGAWLGFSPKDLLPGGRLQRLNDDPDSAISQIDLRYEEAGEPDKTTTFYRRTRAERQQLARMFETEGHKQPAMDADAIMMKRGLTRFGEHPWRHLALSILVLWRAGTATSIILLATLLAAVRWRRYELALFVLPALSMVGAYALSSEFFPRYVQPMYLLAVVAFVPLLVLLTQRVLESHRGVASP